MHKICTSLWNNGFEVTLIGRQQREDSLPKSLPFRTKRMKLLFSSGKLFYLEYNFRLFIHLLFSSYNIFSSIDCDTAWANYFAAKIRRRKWVFDAHELFSEVPEVIRRPLTQKIWRYTEKTLLKRADDRYTVGQKIGEYYEKLYGAPFKVIKNAPHLEKYSPGKIEISEPFVLYQGALNEGRGLEILLKSMQHLETKLVLIGEGDLSAKLRSMVKELDIQDKVIFRGFLLPEEMKAYTYSATIGINMSENKGLSYYLSLNNKFFDYLHAGLPAVTNDFPEYRNLNDRYNVVLLAHTDENSMVQAIQELLENDELYGKLKENCYLASQELNWAVEERKLIEIYEGIE